jgi:hypothetical protein
LWRITPEATATAAETAGEIVLAVASGPHRSGAAPAQALEAELRRRFPRHRATVLVARPQGGEVKLLAADDLAADGRGESLPYSLIRGGVLGSESALRPLLQEAVGRSAIALALVGDGPHDAAVDWVGRLLAPILEGGFDYVCPTYQRPATQGTLNSGIVYPLTRALYGKRLRQPLGGEVALSATLASQLLAEADWRRDPLHAGSDAWLVAKVLARGHRACHAWLGAYPREPADPEDASHALTRVLGPVFREMERNAERWQRVAASQPLPTFGDVEYAPRDEAPPDPEPLVEAFRRGLRDLTALWGLVLPPAALFALRRAAAAPTGSFRMADELWARIVYDFAVAHFAKTMERRQLLASMTPLYLGWVASFFAEVGPLDGAAAEGRVEALCTAFEREKRYLIARWRWPDTFNP